MGMSMCIICLNLTLLRFRGVEFTGGVSWASLTGGMWWWVKGEYHGERDEQHLCVREGTWEVLSCGRLMLIWVAGRLVYFCERYVYGCQCTELHGC